MKALFTVQFLLIALFSFIQMNTPCYAQANLSTVNIEINMDSAPAKASGLLILPKTIDEIADTQIEELGNGRYLISYQVKKSLLNSSTLFSAVAVSADGEYFYGSLKSGSNATQYLDLPACEVSNPMLAIQKGDNVMRSKHLLDICEKRRDVKMNNFYAALDPHTAKPLTNLSKWLGLDDDIDLLDRKVPPLQKIYRLAQLENMLREYLNKGKKEIKAVKRYQEDYQ